jgi:hypothetical protein
MPERPPDERQNTMNITLLNQASRKAALTIAGLAVAGGAIAGPATAAHAAPADKPTVAVQTQQDNGKAAKEVRHDYQRQPNFYFCGPAATRIAVTAQGHTPSQDDLAGKLGTTEAGTNSAEDTTRVLNAMTGKDVYQTRSIPGPKPSAAETDRLAADVKHAIDSGRAVVANIKGTATDVDGTSHSYEGGHYLTVVGYQDDGKTVKIADPAETRGDGSYWMPTTDVANWIAERGYSA